MNHLKLAAMMIVATGCARSQPAQTAARSASPPSSSAAPTVVSTAPATNPLGKRCGNDLGPSTFQNANTGHILLANFYAVSPEDVQFAESATAQIETELRRFKEEELPKLAVEVPTDDVEFQRLNCFVDSHQEAERVGKAWQAELVIWGKAYRDTTPAGNQPVNIQQTVNTGKLQATESGNAVAGQINVQPSTPNAVAPSATLLRPEANLHRTGKAIDFANLAHLDLPTLSLSAPFQLVEFTLGLHFYEQKRYPIAARFFEASVKKILNPKDRNLGTLYQVLGRAYLELPGGLQQAIEFSGTALEQFQGTGTSTEAVLLSNIGFALLSQGKYAEALTCYQRALAIKEKVLGKDHPSVATGLNNIGEALDAQGKYAEALTYFQRALAIDEKAFGKDHSSVAPALNNIGLALRNQGKYAEALTYYQHSLAINEKAFGKDHPSVAVDLINIGAALDNQSKYAEALTYYQRALAIDEKALGKDHPSVATDLNNIGEALRNQRKYAEALTYYQHSLAINEKALGKDHPSVAGGLNNIGLALNAEGKYAEALAYCQRALAIDEKALGKDHPSVAIALNNIGSALNAQGKHAEALTHYQRALDIAEKALGNGHPIVATRLNNIGSALDNQGKHVEALTYYQRALAIDEKALGWDHPNTSTVRDNLAICLASIAGWRKKASKGAIVSVPVAGSSAETLGLQIGDWIVKYAGATVRNGAHFAELTQASDAQANVELEVIRNGKRLKLQAKGGKLGVWLAN